MKHVALTLLAVACGALSASATDATSARIWLEKKVKNVDFATIGGGLSNEKYGATPTYSRSWQYVSIPVSVEGAIKTDDRNEYAHFIPELTVRVTLAVKTADKDGKPQTKNDLELLTKEITYVDIPLVKSQGHKVGRSEGSFNVGVFISPSTAFKLSEKDGNLSKKLVAVAVEGTFNGSACNRVKEKPNEDVEVEVTINDKEGKKLAANWWKKKGGSNMIPASIAETPFAAEYAKYGFPAMRSIYGASPAPLAPETVGGLGSPAPAAGGPVGGTVGGPMSGSVGGPSLPAPAADAEADSSAPAADEEGTKDKKSKKDKKSRR